MSLDLKGVSKMESINKNDGKTVLHRSSARTLPKRTHVARSAIAVAVSALTLTGNAGAATTEFSVTGTTGTISITSGGLSANLANLNSGTGVRAYNSQFFTPASTGSYTFGTQSANFDTVLVFYQGSFSAASPRTNAIAINDDSGGAQFTHGLSHASSCSTNNYCSELIMGLTAGVQYTVLTTTYGLSTTINGTVWYYVIGDQLVAVGAPGVLASARAMGNRPAYGAAAVIDANPGLVALFTGLVGDAPVSNAATQTLPLLFGGSILATRNVLGDINRVIQARQEGNQGLSSGDEFYGDRHVWVKPFGSWADQDARDGVAGFKSESYGMVFGADGTLSDVWRVGGAFAYAQSDVRGTSSVAPQSAKIDLYQLIGYGSYNLDDRTAVNFQADAGQNTSKGRRAIAFTSSTASSNYTSNTAHLGVGVGRTYGLSEQTSVIPSLRADYTWIEDRSYSESGAGLLNLSVNGRTAEALVVGFDGKVVHRLDEQTMLVANLGIGYDTINKQATVTSAFAGAPGASFITYGIKPSPWLLRGGVGAVYKMKDGPEIAGHYDVEYRDNFLNQTASVKLRWAF
jgi:outer membrane autotransporter protein